jgi:hypothetical protein
MNNADYLAYQSSGSVVFQPVTPRAYRAFEALALPMDERGSFRAPDEATATDLFDRLDAQGLEDFTTA